MSSNGKGIFKNLFTPKISCGCSDPKLTDIINPRPRPRPKASAHGHHNQMMLITNPLSSSSGSWDRNGSTSRDQDDKVEKEDLTSTTFSLTSVASSSEESGNHNTPCKAVKTHTQDVLGDSVAMEKHSVNPYDDFQQSILQMIVQKQMYSKSDLQELLNCFLRLNSPLHHHTIIKAFTDLLYNASTCNINAPTQRFRYMSMKELKDASCNS